MARSTTIEEAGERAIRGKKGDRVADPRMVCSARVRRVNVRVLRVCVLCLLLLLPFAKPMPGPRRLRESWCLCGAQI